MAYGDMGVEVGQDVQGALLPGIPDQPVGEPVYHVSFYPGQAIVIHDADAPADLRPYLLELMSGIAGAMVDAPGPRPTPVPGIDIQADVMVAESRGRQKAKQARIQPRPVERPAPKPAMPTRGRGDGPPRPKGPCMRCKTDSWVENGLRGWQCGRCLPL